MINWNLLFRESTVSFRSLRLWGKKQTENDVTSRWEKKMGTELSRVYSVKYDAAAMENFLFRFFPKIFENDIFSP